MEKQIANAGKQSSNMEKQNLFYRPFITKREIISQSLQSQMQHMVEPRLPTISGNARK